MESEDSSFDDEPLARYRRAEHWETILRGCDAAAAGDRHVKLATTISGLSSGIDAKLHEYLSGISQCGKTWLQMRIGTLLFPNFEKVDVSSPRAPYYEAKTNPQCFKHTIRMYDEFGDHSEEFQNQIKSFTTHGVSSATLTTVDKQRHFLKVRIDGLPVVWTNSAVPLWNEQILNRFWKTNVDESAEQDEKVEGYQQEEEKFGDICVRHEETIRRARQEVESILSEKNLVILNPFADFWNLRHSVPRNTRPMIASLVKVLAYSNRVIRPHLSNTTILASLTDNLVAFFVWSWFEKYQVSKVPERYLKLLNALAEGRLYTNSDLADAYAIKYPTERKLSPATCYLYAFHLEKLNLVGSDWDGKRKLWVRISGAFSSQCVSYSPGGSISSLAFESLEFRFPTSDVLAETLSDIYDSNLTNSQSQMEHVDFDALAIELLDWEFLAVLARVLDLQLPALAGSSSGNSSTTVLDNTRVDVPVSRAIAVVNDSSPSSQQPNGGLP